jgi:hypothetical protein
VSAWTVIVRDPTNSVTLATVTNGAMLVDGVRQPVIRSFDPPIVTPPGSGRVLNLFVKQSALAIPPRAIIQFLIDGEPVFWGPAVIVPPAGAPGAGPFDRDRDAIERVTVMGGEQLWRDSVCGPRYFDLEEDVSTLALVYVQRYGHPAITAEPITFPPTGALMNVYYRPESNLYDTLQRLVELVPGGATCWVDAEGVAHFQAHESE